MKTDTVVVADSALDSPSRKKLGKRAGRDRSQRLRRAFQISFLVLNLWIGLQFYFFVRYYESGSATFRASRPAGVEGWLPIASLMNLKVLLVTGRLPEIHPAGTLLLISFLTCSWIFRKSFCSWLCPVGAVSEYLARIGRKLFRRKFRLPRPVDIPLRGVKYLLLAFFLYAVGSMPVAAIREFLGSAYGTVDDVKMLNFFRELSVVGGMVILGLLVGSVLIESFWCRYLCPYGALMSVAAVLSPLRIHRNTGACIDCAKCAKACPASLPVDRLINIRSLECSTCLQCVASCPADGALMLAAPGRKRVPAWLLGAGVAGLFLGSYLFGISTGHWGTRLTDSEYFRLIPHADDFGHP